MRTTLRSHHWHMFIMILCFIYGGVSLLFFIFQVTPALNPQEGMLPFERIMIDNQINDTNGPGILPNTTPPRFEQNNNTFNSQREQQRLQRLRSQVSSFVYIMSAVSLIGSFISIFAGISLLALLRKKERKEIKKGMIDTLTTPEEKIVINELEDNNGELTQSELVKNTKIAKVKMHRILRHLETLKIVEKFPYGMTNKIVLYSKNDDEHKPHSTDKKE